MTEKSSTSSEPITQLQLAQVRKNAEAWLAKVKDGPMQKWAKWIIRPDEIIALCDERDALVWHLMMLADITPQRPIRADELEDVLLHGKEVEDDYETAFGLMHHLAEEVITPERRAAAEAWHEARVREAFEKLPQQFPKEDT